MENINCNREGGRDLLEEYETYLKKFKYGENNLPNVQSLSNLMEKGLNGRAPTVRTNEEIDIPSSNREIVKKEQQPNKVFKNPIREKRNQSLHDALKIKSNQKDIFEFLQKRNHVWDLHEDEINWITQMKTEIGMRKNAYQTHI